MRLPIVQTFFLGMIATLLLNSTGCMMTSEPAAPVQKQDVLDVYVDQIEGDGVGAILIAKIRIVDGKINLTQLSIYPENDLLETAISEISSKGNLSLAAERMDGGRLVMSSQEVTPNDPNYIYALRDELVIRYGLKATVSKEAIMT